MFHVYRLLTLSKMADGHGGSTSEHHSSHDDDDGEFSLQMWRQPFITSESHGSEPGPRAAHISALLGNRFFVFGGWDGKKALNNLHVLDVERIKWLHVVALGVPPSARNNHAAVVIGQKVKLIFLNPEPFLFLLPVDFYSWWS